VQRAATCSYLVRPGSYQIRHGACSPRTANSGRQACTPRQWPWALPSPGLHRTGMATTWPVTYR